MCLRRGAAGVVPMLPRQWPVGEGQSDQGLGTLEGADLPGSSLDVQLLSLYRAQLRTHGVVGR